MVPAVVPERPLGRTEAAFRWAELLRQIFEVDPLVCPACGGTMRIVACITLPAVIERILTHLRARAATTSSASPIPLSEPVVNPDSAPPTARRTASLVARSRRRFS